VVEIFKSEQRIAFYEQVLQRVRNIPGVQFVAGTSDIPLTGSEDVDAIFIEGQPLPLSLDKMPLVLRHAITGDYLRTLRIPLLQGREFTDHDDAKNPGVALANEAFVKRYIPGENPLGKRIRFGGPNEDSPWLTIVGLVADVRHTALEQDAKAQVYLPFLQHGHEEMSLVLRTTGDPSIGERNS